MRTEVSILHNDYPATARDFVGGKLQPLSRFFERTQSLRAVLGRVHDEHRVELVAHVSHGQTLVIDHRADSFGRAVEEAVDRMARALSKHKDKLTSRLGHGVKTSIVVRKASGRNLAALGKLVDEGAIRPVIAKVFALADIAEAHRASESGRTRGKNVVQVLADGDAPGA